MAMDCTSAFQAELEELKNIVKELKFTTQILNELLKAITGKTLSPDNGTGSGGDSNNSENGV